MKKKVPYKLSWFWYFLIHGKGHPDHIAVYLNGDEVSTEWTWGDTLMIMIGMIIWVSILILWGEA